jgi:hypothetical protein
MKTPGYDQPVYILPFDHRGSFVTKMCGWHGGLTAAQTAEIAAAKQVIYDGFKTAIAEGAPKNKAGILVDEQFGAAILCDAKTDGFTTACPAIPKATCGKCLNRRRHLAASVRRKTSRRPPSSWRRLIRNGSRVKRSSLREVSAD